MSADPTLVRAEQVQARLLALGLHTALIGSFAMSAHGYQRETRDIDLGLAVAVPQLRRAAAELRAAGYEIELREPDAADGLGGRRGRGARRRSAPPPART